MNGRRLVRAMAVLLGVAFSGAALAHGATVPSRGAAFESRCNVSSLSGMRACLEKAAGIVGSAVGSAADMVKRVATGGLAYLKSTARQVWSALKGADCPGVVAALGRLDPFTVLAGKLWAPLRTCMNEIHSGMICGIPGFVADVGRMIYGSAQEAWNHKRVCLTRALLTMPVPAGGALLCGFAYWAGPRLAKVGRCLSSLRNSQILKILVESALQAGCNLIGSLLADAFLTGLTGGATLGATIARWIKRAADAISPANWMKIAHKIKATTVDTAIQAAQSAVTRLHDCK